MKSKQVDVKHAPCTERLRRIAPATGRQWHPLLQEEEGSDGLGEATAPVVLDSDFRWNTYVSTRRLLLDMQCPCKIPTFPTEEWQTPGYDHSYRQSIFMSRKSRWEVCVSIFLILSTNNPTFFPLGERIANQLLPFGVMTNTEEIYPCSPDLPITIHPTPPVRTHC